MPSLHLRRHRAGDGPARTRGAGRNPGPARPPLQLQVARRRRRCGAPLAEFMPTITVAHGQGVGDGDDTRRGVEGGLQHHGAFQVATSHVCGVRDPDRPIASFVTEEATEDRWAVEAWESTTSRLTRPGSPAQRCADPRGAHSRLSGSCPCELLRTSAGPVLAAPVTRRAPSIVVGDPTICRG